MMFFGIHLLNKFISQQIKIQIIWGLQTVEGTLTRRGLWIEKLEWAYKTRPKNYISVNKPVVQGFRGGLLLDPNLVILTLADEVCEGKDKYRLYNLYKVWESFVD